MIFNPGISTDQCTNEFFLGGKTNMSWGSLLTV